MNNPPTPPRSSDHTAATHDLIVIGAGGAGLAAALFGALRGLKVLLLESTEYIGGTTAFSAATRWTASATRAAPGW